jgi:hypothetical protein
MILYDFLCPFKGVDCHDVESKKHIIGYRGEVEAVVTVPTCVCKCQNELLTMTKIYIGPV